MTDITQSNFSSEILDQEQVLLDFWAPWCSSCRLTASLLNEAQIKYPSLKIVKINIDDNPELFKEHNIQLLPTLILYKHGKSMFCSSGPCSWEELEYLLNLHLV